MTMQGESPTNNQLITGLEEYWELKLEGKSHSPVDKILADHLPTVVALFRTKARDYSAADGNMAASLLGSRGQFAEIWRKIPKLKKGMWDHEKLENESVPEILRDIIGHCLLALDYYRTEEQEKKTSPFPGIPHGGTLMPGFGTDTYKQGLKGEHLP